MVGRLRDLGAAHRPGGPRPRRGRLRGEPSHRRPVPRDLSGRARRRPDRVDPRRRRADPRRGRHAPVLAGDDARRHRAHDGAAEPGRGAIEVRGARGADPRDRLRRPRRRVDAHDLREPPDRGDPRLHAAAVHRRPRSVVGDAPSGRPRDGARDLRARPRRRRAVHVRVPARRTGRARGVVPRQRGRPARIGRPAGADPGRHARHHRAASRRGAARVPRLPRQPHGPAEQGDVRRAARARPRPRPEARPRRRRGHRRRRQLQARQRLARTRGRRRADHPAGGASPRSDP